jgi:hypothetical protein
VWPWLINPLKNVEPLYRLSASVHQRRNGTAVGIGPQTKGTAMIYRKKEGLPRRLEEREGNAGGAQLNAFPFRPLIFFAVKNQDFENELKVTRTN